MKNRSLSIYTILFTAILVSSCNQKQSHPPASSEPNIILVMCDDLGWGDVGCYGNDFIDTPRIDQLAKEGVRFTDAYAACAVCSPTRAAILTGKYPARLLLTQWLPSGMRSIVRSAT